MKSSRSLTPVPAAPGGSVNISTILEDSRGRLWAGNDAGLAVLETDGRWRLLNDRPGFDNHHVFCIGEDWKGTVWVNTARGVFRFLADYKVEAFNPDDGLADWETNANGFFSDARGDIWIGTISGLSQYNPAGRSPNTEPPRLVVENVRLPKRQLEYPLLPGPGLERADAHLRTSPFSPTATATAPPTATAWTAWRANGCP